MFHATTQHSKLLMNDTFQSYARGDQWVNKTDSCKVMSLCLSYGPIAEESSVLIPSLGTNDKKNEMEDPQ